MLAVVQIGSKTWRSPCSTARSVRAPVGADCALSRPGADTAAAGGTVPFTNARPGGGHSRPPPPEPARVLTHGTHPGGGGAPPGDTMIPCQELADDRWTYLAPSTKARPAAVVRTPQQSAERRAGHGPVISGDPEIGPTARRVTGCG